MSVRFYVAGALLWLLSLVAVAAAASAQARAYVPLLEPKVLTGADIGFRVEGMYGDTPAGALVIRVNGQWVEARLGKPGYSTKTSE